MLEGRRAKARRGELGKSVPMGYVHRPSGEVAFDPDEQAQATIRLVFDLFVRFRTVGKVMRYLVDHDIRMPVRVRGGPRKGELEWRRVNRVSLHNLFANPIYAGVYVYGGRPIDRRRQKPGRPSTGRRPFRIENAEVFLPDRMPAYISWEQYQRNQVQLRSNKAANAGVARAGQALFSIPTSASQNQGSQCGPTVPGSRLEADHPENGVPIARRNTLERGSDGRSYARRAAAARGRPRALLLRSSEN